MSSEFFIPSQSKSGFYYFFRGMALCMTPGIRRFVILPMLTNFVILAGTLFYLKQNISQWLDSLLAPLPDWLSWLNYLLIPIIFLVVIAVFGYFFSTLANWIAAPFNGLLAEKLEAKLTGDDADDQSMLYILKDTPRILVREWKKIIYCLPRAVFAIVLFFIPGVGQTIAPIVWFIFSAWMLVIQYCDYPFDNHKVPFADMKDQLQADRTRSYSFGIVVNFFTMIPFLNWFVMPIAVCGATAMWVDCYKPYQMQSSPNQTSNSQRALEE